MTLLSHQVPIYELYISSGWDAAAAYEAAARVTLDSPVKTSEVSPHDPDPMPSEDAMGGSETDISHPDDQGLFHFVPEDERDPEPFDPYPGPYRSGGSSMPGPLLLAAPVALRGIWAGAQAARAARNAGGMGGLFGKIFSGVSAASLADDVLEFISGGVIDLIPDDQIEAELAGEQAKEWAKLCAGGAILDRRDPAEVEKDPGHGYFIAAGPTQNVQYDKDQVAGVLVSRWTTPLKGRKDAMERMVKPVITRRRARLRVK